jgi:heptosyltransferase-2
MSSDLVTFYSRTRKARKVIVVDLGFLGDTVHLLPALWELKQNYPQAALHVLTSTVGKDVLRLAPWVDQVWGIELYADRRTLRQQWEIIRSVRRETFNIAFNFSSSDRAIFTTALTGAHRRVGCRSSRWHFYNRWLLQEWAPEPDPNLIAFEQRRSVLRACGMSLGAPRFEMRIEDSSASWAAGIVPRFALHISPNSAKATREWPLEQHVSLLKKLWADYPDLHVMVSGSAREREGERLRALEAAVRDPRLRLMPPNLSISQLAALLARCRLHVGPDSGVLHLAVALNVPTVSFFRQQGGYKSFMPAGPNHHVISMPCHCVDHHNAPCERLGYSECFAQIQPARVAAAVGELLARTVK